MALEIAKAFVVNAGADAAWQFLTDPARVARCLPGAAITGQVDDKTYAGTITVKVGPVAATYKGKMTFEQLDSAARTAVIAASGQDVRGKGGADMRMTSRLVERSPAETEISITSQVNVMGILAQFGRGMIQDVSDQMFEKFVAGMRAELEPQPGAPPPAPAAPETANTPDVPVPQETKASTPDTAAVPRPPAATATAAPAAAIPASAPAARQPASAPPIEVLSFGSAVVGRAAGRAVRRPLLWIVLVVVVMAMYWWLR